MSTNTSIEWTDVSWNPVRGCSLVSAGCTNCYAMKQAHRFSGRGKPYEGLTEKGPQSARWTGKITLVPDALDEPLRWKKPQRIFVNSMSDLFHEDVPFVFITAVFGVMAAAPQHIFQVLTKRPERMRAWFLWLGDHGGLGPYIRSIRVDGDRTLPNFFNVTAKTEVVRGKTYRGDGDPWMMVFNAAACIGNGHLHNVHLIVSAENQETLDQRVHLLLETPAAVRGVSLEPLLGPISLRWAKWADCNHPQAHWPTAENQYDGLRMLDWVIVGGESGPGSRPCDLAWIRTIKDQCQEAGVKVFVKQIGGQPRGWCSGIAHSGDPEASFEKDYCDLYEASEIAEPCKGKCMELADKKGGDMAEWPEDLRIREFPQ